ncbi:MAG: inositol monophosphatase family protein [Chloroflexota bacterium]
MNNLSETSYPLRFASEVCQRAGSLLLSYFRKTELNLSRKADRSLVSEADIAADELITTAIQQQFPSDFILSEELSPSITTTSSTGWVIDPLDGTTNFSLGMHYWGVLLTRIENGLPSLTVQYFPAIDEIYQAQIHQQSLLNNQPIHVESPASDQKLSFFSCCSRAFRHYDINIRYKTRIFGSAAYSMANVARGACRIAFEAEAKIWDIAGAWLLVPQAGGVIAPLTGRLPFPLTPSGDFSKQSFPIIAASSSLFLEEAINKIHLKNH